MDSIDRGCFNPRSREGSDTSTGVGLCCSACFNPRSREGSDPSETSPLAIALSFNPRSREGSDGFAAARPGGRHQFQSTLP